MCAIVIFFCRNNCTITYSIRFMRKSEKFYLLFNLLPIYFRCARRLLGFGLNINKFVIISCII